MKNQTLVIFGIVTYTLTVISTVEDVKGNYTSPAALILGSAIAIMAFTVMASIRLWKIQKIVSILLIVSPIVSFFYYSIFSRGICTIIFIWAMTILWNMTKEENKIIKTLRDLGLTDEEYLTILREKKNGNNQAVVELLSTVQERSKNEIKETTGIDLNALIPEIGKEVSWLDIVNHTFRVLSFDRSGTTISSDNKVKAKSTFKPYGYLLAESPILNNKVKIPIIHKDDFLLASSVFDDPKWEVMVLEEEMLVTYSPKHLLSKGLSGSPHHVLHYAITPRGTLDTYYSMNNDQHFAIPDPEKIYGPFVYQGEIKVQLISGIKRL